MSEDESFVLGLRTELQRARAGGLSIYGLFGLLDDLRPVPHQLERARKRRDEDRIDAFTSALLAAEEELASATSDAKRLLAEELERGIESSNVTARERDLALTFLEEQLQATAQDISAKAAARGEKLREKRAQLESCVVVKESLEVRSLEKKLGELSEELADVGGTYESWQAGKMKFKSNDQLQATKRRYEVLKREVESTRRDVQAALRKRRAPELARPAPVAHSGGRWGTGRSAAGPVSSSSSTLTSEAAEPKKKVAPVQRTSASVWGDADAIDATSFSVIEVQHPQRKVPPPTKAGKLKGEALKEAKRRGREVLEELAAGIELDERAPPEELRVPQAAWWQQEEAVEASRHEATNWDELQREASAAWEAADTEAAFTEDVSDDLPPGWDAVWSEAHGAYYYWRTETDETTWEKPALAAPAARSRQLPPAVSNGYGSYPPESDVPQQKLARKQSAAAAVAKAKRAEEAAAFEGDYVEEVNSRGRDDGPTLSFACVCSAVAAELGLPVKEVHELGISSVDEWQANFAATEWARIRERALEFERAKKSLQLKVEKTKAKQSLDKVACREEMRTSGRGRSGGLIGITVQSPAPQKGRGRGASTAQAHASKKAAAKPRSEAKVGGIKSLATHGGNRFGAMQQSDSGSSNDEG
eukprot:gnl/TRDRNA2_/TRDRNA2_82287_c0_seq1.p1 gnl/TRDRNA2_/TRDRNA2_82287_c0~~gnl/TRDRNA2_/TRDRNA2_82287_c0_seq1.p1  ORF type:complete len:649 (-),score=198.25 gnl/TRDRNA2_/TRDRNA2_82287_c0_seq1:37-1983(-)